MILGTLAFKAILGYITLLPFSSQFLSLLLFDTPFYVLNLIFTSVFLGLSLLYTYNKKYRFRALDKIVLIFFLTIIISSIISHNPINSSKEVYKYLSLITLFYIVRVTKKNDRKLLCITLIISAILVAIYSLRSLFIVTPYTLKYIIKHQIDSSFAREFLSRRRAFAPFISPNLLANYLAMTIMFSSGFILEALRKKKKTLIFLLSIVCFLLGSLALLFTKSIGGWLSLLISAIIFIILAKKINKKILIILLLVIVLTSLMFLMRTKTDNQFTSPFFSLSKRAAYWAQTLKLIKQHPLTGIGVGNFSLEETKSAHNSYLQIWAETGLLGIISWLGIVFIFFRKAIKLRNSKVVSYSNLGVISAGSCFLVHNIIDYSFFFPQVSFLWWIMLALTEGKR